MKRGRKGGSGDKIVIEENLFIFLGRRKVIEWVTHKEWEESQFFLFM